MPALLTDQLADELPDELLDELEQELGMTMIAKDTKAEGDAVMLLGAFNDVSINKPKFEPRNDQKIVVRVDARSYSYRQDQLQEAGAQPVSSLYNGTYETPQTSLGAITTTVTKPLADVTQRIDDSIDAIVHDFHTVQQALRGIKEPDEYTEVLFDDVESLKTQLTIFRSGGLVDKIREISGHYMSRASRADYLRGLVQEIDTGLQDIGPQMGEASKHAIAFAADVKLQVQGNGRDGNSGKKWNGGRTRGGGKGNGNGNGKKQGQGKRKGKGKGKNKQAAIESPLPPYLQPLLGCLRQSIRILGILSKPAKTVMDDSDSTSATVPQELLATRLAADKIFELLCRSCPNHGTHQLLLGLTTGSSKQKGDASDTHFYLALLRRQEEETTDKNLWFKVVSMNTTGSHSGALSANGHVRSQSDVARPRPHGTISAPSIPCSQTSFQDHASRIPAESPLSGPRFCLSNHAQYTSELAVELDDSVHQLFYPDKDYLGLLHAPRKSLEQWLVDPKSVLEDCEKVRWMRLIAEAVLKFGVLRGLTVNLDAWRMWSCQSDASSAKAYYWHVELMKQSDLGLYGDRGGKVEVVNLDIAETLRKLGRLFLRILLSPEVPTGHQEEDLQAAEDGGLCGPRFMVVLGNCLNGCVGTQKHDGGFSDEKAQGLFYKRVVQVLRDLEKI